MGGRQRLSAYWQIPFYLPTVLSLMSRAVFITSMVLATTWAARERLAWSADLAASSSACERTIPN